MDKIYSRFRIRLPKINRKVRVATVKIRKKIGATLLIIIFVILVPMYIVKAIQPIFENLCTEKAKSLATIISNEQATNVMKNYSYENLFEIDKDNEGKITMMKSNIITINEITSDIAVKIQNEMNERGRDNIEIALGSFTGSKLLSGRGPNVKIRVSTKGDVETDLRSEFISKGINQTLHRVYLQVSCEAVVLTPFSSIQNTINNQVLLIENVIVGNIPDTFYNFDGTDTKDTAIETIE